MWCIQKAAQYTDHLVGCERNHGKDCLACRIANRKTERVSYHHPVSRDLDIGPGKWTKRFVCPEGPLHDTLTRLKYTETTLNDVSKNSSGDDLIWIVANKPFCPTGLDENAQVVLVHLEPVTRPPKVDNPNVVGQIGVYSFGLAGQPVHMQQLVATSFGPHLRVRWFELENSIRKQIDDWDVFATYHGQDPEHLVYVGF